MYVFLDHNERGLVFWQETIHHTVDLATLKTGWLVRGEHCLVLHCERVVEADEDGTAPAMYFGHRTGTYTRRIAPD